MVCIQTFLFIRVHTYNGDGQEEREFQGLIPRLLKVEEFITRSIDSIIHTSVFMLII